MLLPLSPNLLVQALTLVSGLLVNFLFPALFGLTEYGQFLQTLLATFVLQRIVDVSAEPLIALSQGDQIFMTALTMNGIVAGVLAAIGQAANLRGLDMVLLAAMVVTSTLLLTMHRNRMQAALVGYLAAFVVLFLALTAWKMAMPASVSLRDVLLWTNVGAGSLGLALVAHAGRIDVNLTVLKDTVRSALRLIPRALASSLVSNFLSTAFLLVCAHTLAARDLGLLRVASSIVQSAVSVFPANMKTIFVTLGEDGAPQRVQRLLSASFWLFLALATSVLAAMPLLPAVAPVAALGLVTIPFFWGMCLERYALMTGLGARFRAMNVVAACLLLALSFTVETLDQALVFYGVSISLWCAALALLARASVRAGPVMGVCAIVAVALVLGLRRSELAMLAVPALAAVGWFLLRPDRHTVRVMTGRL